MREKTLKAEEIAYGRPKEPWENMTWLGEVPEICTKEISKGSSVLKNKNLGLGL